MSPNEPLPIFLPNLYFPPTRSSILYPDDEDDAWEDGVREAEAGVAAAEEVAVVGLTGRGGEDEVMARENSFESGKGSNGSQRWGSRSGVWIRGGEGQEMGAATE